MRKVGRNSKLPKSILTSYYNYIRKQIMSNIHLLNKKSMHLTDPTSTEQYCVWLGMYSNRQDTNKLNQLPPWPRSLYSCVFFTVIIWILTEITTLCICQEVHKMSTRNSVNTSHHKCKIITCLREYHVQFVKIEIIQLSDQWNRIRTQN